MIVLFIILLAGISTIEMIGLRRKGGKKDMVILAGLSLMTLAFGCFYISNPYRQSLAQTALNFLDFIVNRIGGRG